MKADENMTDQQRKIEEEKNLAESRERERKLQDDLLRKVEQLEADKKESSEENMRQLRLKMEQDQKRHQDEVAEMHKEYQRLLREGHPGKAHDIYRGINKIEEREPGSVKRFVQWLWQ